MSADSPSDAQRMELGAQRMESGRTKALTQTIWLVSGAVWVGLLVVVGTLLPQRAKLLGLFAPGWGLVAGWGLGELARGLRFHDPRFASVLSALLTAVGFVGLHAAWYRTYSAELGDQRERLRIKLEQNPTAGLKEKVLQQDASEATAEERRSRDEFLKVLERDEQAHAAQLNSIDAQRNVQGYLARRLAPLGSWSWPWPGLFWVGEVAAGALAAGWLVRRVAGRPFCSVCGHWELELRRISLRPREISEILALWNQESQEIPAEATLVLRGCRCSERLPELQLIEGPPDRPTHQRKLGRPSAEMWTQIAGWLDS